MKNFGKTTLILILSIFFTGQVYSSSLLKPVEKSKKKKSIGSDLLKSAGEKSKDGKLQKGKYNLEETTDILKLSKLIDLTFIHDLHLYKIIKISKNAVNLEGAIFVLIESKTKLGDTLDDDEVDLIIKISKLDTDTYQNIMNIAKKIGKTKTTVKEHFAISREFEKGNGKFLYSGIDKSILCNYKIENDYFTKERLQLLIQFGKIQDEDRLMDIFDAMQKVGMYKKINSKGLHVLYKLYNLKGNVAYQIIEYLKVNKWTSRKQPGEREYQVIRDMMKSMQKQPEEETTTKTQKLQVVEKQPVAKKRKAKKRKKSAKRRNEKLDSCSGYIKNE